MASQIVLNFEGVQLAASLMAGVEKEIDSVTSEIFYIKGEASDGWNGEAKNLFVENCESIRRKGVEVTVNLQKTRESLQKAAGILIAAETKNKNIEQNLSTDNIFV